ncbi:DUF1330 domain-containing protein [Parasphingorhabdus sp. DH2-15]|uniref:DUF1330 domain-containing protein n=1 Tax=Parasphingorhabdus sp. DH2-15 TaxID=3444112 RepID=UPI003F682245
MTVYAIAQLTIHDREGYKRYEAGFMEVFAKFDGVMLSIDEEPMVLEGEFTATRSVLIEFPSKEQAMAWMTSPDYQAIAKHRLAASTANSILVKAITADMLENLGS